MEETLKALPLYEIMGLDTPWPLLEVLSRLIEASDILLKERQYDGHGHEVLSAATDKAREIVSLLTPKIICSINCPCKSENDCTGEWALNLIQHEKELRSWPEDSSHENGKYNCICCQCNQDFVGHKRRVICKTCSKAFLNKLELFVT